MALINLRNALMAGKRLPYDAEVEYLESTGTQWIDTGIVPSLNTRIEATVQALARPTIISTGAAINGAAGITYWGSSLSWATKFGTGAYAPAQGIASISTSVIYQLSLDKSNFTVNGTYYPKNATSLSTSSSLRILYDIWNAGLDARVYNLKIYESAVLVRDFIPVRKGTVGYLYDRVSGKLFGNAGTGDFVLGQDVVPVEYIESHGTERIDTGFKADNTCKFRIDMERRGGSDYWLFGSRNGTSTATDKSCLFASVNSSIGYAMMGSAVPSFNSTLIKDGKHMIEMSLADGFVIDGDVSATYTASEQAEVFTNSYPISVFTMYNGSSYFNAFAGRVYLFSITSGGVSRLNLLPVRVGAEGAMMDVLTRRIYRNARTGAFTYGNDLKYPIPAE